MPFADSPDSHRFIAAGRLVARGFGKHATEPGRKLIHHRDDRCQLITSELQLLGNVAANQRARRITLLQLDLLLLLLLTWFAWSPRGPPKCHEFLAFKTGLLIDGIFPNNAGGTCAFTR